MITDSLDSLNIQWIFTDSYLRIIKSDGGYILVCYHFYMQSNICIQSVVKNLFTTSQYKICVKISYLRVNLAYCGTIRAKVCRPYNWSTDLSIHFQTSVIALNGVDTVSTVRVEIWKEIIFLFFCHFFKHLFFYLFLFFHFFTPPPHMIFPKKVDQN